MTEFKDFDAQTVHLSGSNLIEASAGTGKTYSIAILVLRLVLEQNLSIKEILMVTFTKAAVAELEERIRIFIRKAYKVSLGEKIDDDTITNLVKQSVHHHSAESVSAHLKDAILFLDETSVLTIHSFCQLTLTEFAFETQQLFGTDTLKETASVIEDELNKFWRQHITTIPIDLLQYLVDAKMTKDGIRKVVHQHLGGKRYFNYDPQKTYTFCEADHQKIIDELRKIEKESELLKKEIYAYIEKNEAALRKKIEANSNAVKSKFHLFETPEDLRQLINGKRTTQYIEKIFAEVFTQCQDCMDLEVDINARSRQVVDDLNCQAINVVLQGLKEYKERNNLLSFDDMIVNLHKAFTERDSTRLSAALQQKYKAVFVDEFQDTDRMQYEIFQRAFAGNSIVFYIGDPKQSIYSFRKADIFTYFKAKEAVDHRYTMNTNFRSSEKFIDAMNTFFLPQPGFDTFHFKGAPEAIQYHHVQSPASNNKGFLARDRKSEVPISITRVSKKKDISEVVAAQVISLLTDHSFAIVRNDVVERIRPSDIGILVRNKKEATDVKHILARHRIPAISIDDEKILQSEEARSLLHLLEAMVDISRNSINKALLSPFTGYSNQQVLQLDDEVTITLFRRYRIRWQEDGVYTALQEFVSDFNVRGVLLDVHTENGERIIANLFQLIELVHKIQTNKQFSPLELLNWLKRGIEGMEIEGDEYEQRIESDEESVEIITIHKSKGLEYKIVFAPFLDLVENKSHDFQSYRDPTSGDYIVIEKDKSSEEQKGLISDQIEQENRRLIYVAITRAVYKCYLHHAESKYNVKSSLSQFITVLKDPDPQLMHTEEPEPPKPGFRFRNDKAYKPPLREKSVQFALDHNSWTKMSYTMLAKKGEAVSRPASASQSGRYDQFVFTQLTRGNKTGNLLHQVFEHVHFADDKHWEKVIEDALAQHLPNRRELYAPMLKEMIQQVVNLPLTVGSEKFTLSDVMHSNRIHEFEFDFPVPLYNPALLNGMSNQEIDIRVSWDKPLEGIINGKLDLFFGLRGKYYILDWKSNYLGDTLTDYSPQALAAAMNENNYHLQYLIYTLAIKKYLQNRLQGFDYDEHFGGVIYLFVRGVRRDQETGIFVNRPSREQMDLLEKIMAIH